MMFCLFKVKHTKRTCGHRIFFSSSLSYMQDIAHSVSDMIGVLTLMPSIVDHRCLGSMVGHEIVTNYVSLSDEDN
jgi:hypothetical protein